MTTESNSGTHSGVVVGIDDSPGARLALRWALDYAKVTAQTITAVHAYRPSVAWIDVGSPEEEKIREVGHLGARETAEEIVGDVTTAGDVDVETLPTIGDGADALLEVARDANLLVVGSRGRGGFTGVLLGSVSQRCAQHAPCPVVIVPNPATSR